MENTEIEKRFIVSDKQALLSLLELRGKKKYENRQVDTYFVPQHRNFLAEEHPFEWLRLRNDQGKSILTYKHWFPERVKESTHCTEYETTVGDLDAFEKMLIALDFEKIIVVDKLRLAYTFENFEIALDDVVDLGAFLEIEIKDGYRSVSDGLAQIYALAKELNLTELPANHPVRVGYPLPLYRLKQQKIKSSVKS